VQNLIELLSSSPLLLLFVVLALGASLGKIRIAGVSLGIAAVLFAGLGLGSLSPGIKLPSVIYEIGLVLFIYAIGISSGEHFFRNLRHKGWKENLLVATVISMVFAGVITLHFFTNIRASFMAGLFAGSLTNTPALATAVEYLKNNVPDHLSETAQAEPVVAYSVTYPMGVIGMIVAIVVFQKVLRKKLVADSSAGITEHLISATVRITSAQVIGKSISAMKQAFPMKVIFGRLQQQDSTQLVRDHDLLHEGNLITVVGHPAEVERAVSLLGERSSVQLDMDHRHLDMRRVFVSNPDLIGQRIKDLNLPHTMGILITRLRRGDKDILPHANTTLHFGDRVRILTRKENLAEASKFFGDSYSAQSEIDILTLGLGVAAGFFLGLIPIPLPGGLTFKLGIAGGPLLVALVLGVVNRVGKLVFVMPYSSTHTVRQLGLVLFLAGIGTKSGYAFKEILLNSPDGVTFFMMGTAITVLAAFIFLALGTYFRIPFSRLTGMLAGLQTQPAVLAFASEQSGSDQPSIGYASVFPVAMLSKIILVQILLTLLSKPV
jgi:putative transport protein